MTNIQLSAGSVQQLRSKAPPAIKPVLQVISITPSQIGGAERYKLVLSDGQTQTGAILASQLNELAKKGDIRVNSILRLNEFIVNEMQNGFIVVILNVEILENASTTIGNPVDANERVVQQPVTNSNRVFAPAAVPTRSAPTFQAPEQQQQFYGQAAPAQPQSWNQPPQASYQAPQASYQPPQASYQAPAPQQQMYAAQQKPAQSSYNAPVAQLQTMVGGGAAGARAMPRTIPIKLINPYQNKWTIRARVTSKSDIRTWDKGPTNQGKLFSIDLVDNDGGEIRATFFREAVDMFFDMMRVGNVFLFSEGKVKVANRQFSAIKNEYELNFGKEAVIQPVQDDGDIARVHLNPVSIADINNIEPKSTIDVLGVATEISDVTSFISKAGRDLRKMEMQLVDRSNTSIKLTVWGVKADEVANEVRNAGPNPVIAIKSAQVGDFGGRSLGTLSSSSVFVNPHDIPQAGAVRSWFDNGGGRSGVAQLTAGREGGGEARGPAPVKDRLTLDAIKTLGLGKNGQQDFCDVKGYLMFIKKDNMWYPACPTDKCNKKMTKSPAGDRWFCEKCNMDFEEPNYRYIASFQLADATGSNWCTAFNETANALFGGMSASELERLKRDDEARFEEVVNASCFQEGLFRLKIKEEQYNQQSTVKYVVMNYRPIDYAVEVKELQKAIDMYEGKQ